VVRGVGPLDRKEHLSARSSNQGMSFLDQLFIILEEDFIEIFEIQKGDVPNKGNSKYKFYNL